VVGAVLQGPAQPERGRRALGEPGDQHRPAQRAAVAGDVAAGGAHHVERGGRLRRHVHPRLQTGAGAQAQVVRSGGSEPGGGVGVGRGRLKPAWLHRRRVTPVHLGTVGEGDHCQLARPVDRQGQQATGGGGPAGGTHRPVHQLVGPHAVTDLRRREPITGKLGRHCGLVRQSAQRRHRDQSATVVLRRRHLPGIRGGHARCAGHDKRRNGTHCRSRQGPPPRPALASVRNSLAFILRTIHTPECVHRGCTAVHSPPHLSGWFGRQVCPPQPAQDHPGPLPLAAVPASGSVL
jgi:hypothetical protein